MQKARKTGPRCFSSCSNSDAVTERDSSGTFSSSTSSVMTMAKTPSARNSTRVFGSRKLCNPSRAIRGTLVHRGREVNRNSCAVLEGAYLLLRNRQVSRALARDQAPARIQRERPTVALAVGGGGGCGNVGALHLAGGVADEERAAGNVEDAPLIGEAAAWIHRIVAIDGDHGVGIVGVVEAVANRQHEHGPIDQLLARVGHTLLAHTVAALLSGKHFVGVVLGGAGFRLHLRDGRWHANGIRRREAGRGPS